MADDKTEITALIRQYASAITAGDAAAWIATLADDVVIQPPDHPQIDGRAAATAWGKQSFFDPFQMHLDFRIDQIEVFGDYAFGRGQSTLNLTLLHGVAMMPTRGTFMNLFKREPTRSWRYACAAFNFDAPLAASAGSGRSFVDN